VLVIDRLKIISTSNIHRDSFVETKNSRSKSKISGRIKDE